MAGRGQKDGWEVRKGKRRKMEDGIK